METQKHPLDFMAFVKHCFKLSWKKAGSHFGVARAFQNFAVATILLGAAGFGLGNSKVVPVSLWWLALVPTGILAASFLWHSIKAPHDVYLELEQKRQTDVGSEQTKVSKLEKELAATKSQIETEEAKAAKEKAISDGLGGFVIEFQNIRREIDAVFFTQYEEPMMKEKDATIIGTINAMLAWLGANLGLGYAAIMRDLRPKQMPPDTTWDRLSQQKRLQEIQLNFLDAYISQLKTILEDYLTK